MRCVSSRFLTALPRLFAASISSPDRRAAIVVSLRAAGGSDQPADGQRLGALGADLDRDLVGRTADAAAADLDARLHIVERVVEQLDRVGLGLGLDGRRARHRRSLGDGLLAVVA